MNQSRRRSFGKGTQYWLNLLVVAGVSVLCFALAPATGYKVVAYVLLVTVSFLALFCDIVPVLIAATLSALIWDYFFIPPRFTFQVGSTEDSFLLLMYYVIALVHATLTYKLKQIQKVAQQREEKAAMVRLYSTLLNSLSHELRTPIATIIGATDNLMDPDSRVSDENKSSLISEISIAALRLNHQVENLLNMSRLEAGAIKLRLDWCEMTELVYASIRRLEEVAKDHVLDISIPESLPLVKLDTVLFEQALFNLLSNAVQYTPKGSIISVTVACSEGICRIVLEDNGPGFPKDALERVFDKFYRLDQSPTGGTGLGLSIAKGFVEAHGGRIVLENAPLGGARFTITVPVETAESKIVVP
ncbi:sensor histidine kinase [Flaviaesturariibacter terrae]